jgi:subtilisin family serine protease
MANKRIAHSVLIALLVGILSVVPGVVAQETTPDPVVPTETPIPEVVTPEEVIVTETEPVVETPTDTPTETEVIPTETEVVTDEPVATETETIVTDEPVETTPEVVVTDAPVETTPEAVEPTPEVTDEPVATTPAPVIVVTPSPIPDDEYDNNLATERGADTTTPATVLTIPTSGDVRVIVQLSVQGSRTSQSTDSSGGDTPSTPAPAAIRSAQQTLAQQMVQFGATVHHQYSSIPYMSMTTSQAGLNHLRQSPLVTFIRPDVARQRALASSTDVIGVTTSNGANLNVNYTGNGWVVAVLDGMSNFNHSFLQGRYVDPACFFGSGSSRFSNFDQEPNCAFDNHGTHVAGTVAGGGNVVIDGQTGIHNGVARDATIMPVGVFTGLDAFDSDILAGLQYVLDHTDDYDIAAVNMSLGGGRHFGVCDAQYPDYFDVVAQLRNAGVITVAASGNDGYIDSMSAPACVSNIVSVGATTDTDGIAVYSNAAANLDFWAPGGIIPDPNNPDERAIWSSSATSGNFYASSGTSMASPHVAGAIALMRERHPDATIDEILGALRTSGVTVQDISGLSFPRIQVDDAIGQLFDIFNPPVGTQFDFMEPQIQWELAENDELYEIYINGPQGQVVYNETFEADSFDITCTASFCNRQVEDILANDLPAGTYAIYIRATGSTYGQGWWMGPHTIELVSPSQNAPIGGINSPIDGRITYSWEEITDATYYRLYVQNSSNVVVIDEWVTAAEANCGGGTCAYQSEIPLVNGEHTWYVRGWKPDTYTPWSSGESFTLTVNPPAPPTLETPTELDTLLPDLQWDATSAEGATYFGVYLHDPLGGVILWDENQWFTREEVCGSPTGTDCSVEVPQFLTPGVSYDFWVRSYGAGGIGNWAGPESFMLADTPPALPANLTEDAIATRGDPTFSWDDDTLATHFELYVASPTGALLFNQWFEKGNSDMTCNAGTCSVYPGVLLSNGLHNWYVRAYGSGGYSVGGNNGYAEAAIDLNLPEPDADDFDVANTFQVLELDPLDDLDQPLFVWNDIDNANYYELYINDITTGAIIFNQWLRRSEINCSTNCIFQIPDYYFTVGTYGFYVRAYGPAGFAINGIDGSGYNGDTFAVRVSTPNFNEQRPFNLTRVPPETDPTPLLQWAHIDGATWYRVYMVDSQDNVVFDQWKQYASGCATTCSWPNIVNLDTGTYRWWVQGYGAAGYTLWSDSNLGTPDVLDPSEFNITVPAPSATTLIGPANNTIAEGPVTFEWNNAANTTYYYLQVYADSEVLHGIWYPSENVCTSTCSVTLDDLPVGTHSWRVLTYGPGLPIPPPPDIPDYPASEARGITILEQ